MLDEPEFIVRIELTSNAQLIQMRIDWIDFLVAVNFVFVYQMAAITNQLLLKAH